MPHATPAPARRLRGLPGGRLARRLFVLFLVAALAPLVVAASLSLAATTTLAEDLRQRAHIDRTRQTSRHLLDQLIAARDLLATWPPAAAGHGPGSEPQLPGLGSTFSRAEIATGPAAATASPQELTFRLQVLPSGEGALRLWLVRDEGERSWRAEIAQAALWAPIIEGGTDTRWQVYDASGRLLMSHDPGLERPDDVRSASIGLPLEGLFSAGAWRFEHQASREQLRWQGLTLGSWMGLVALVTAGSVALLAHWRIRRIFQPLERLTEGTQRIALGDTGNHAGLPGSGAQGDEIDVLARSFDDMAGRIDEQLGLLRELAAIDHDILGGQPVARVVGRLHRLLERVAPGPDAAVWWCEHTPGLDGSPCLRLQAVHGGPALAPPTPLAWQALEQRARAGALDDDEQTRHWLPPRQAPTPRILVPALLGNRLAGLVVAAGPSTPALQERMATLRDRLVVTLTARTREHELAWRADHDSLTGLLNRRGLNDQLDRLLAAAGPGAAMAVLMIDLDHFKDLNDTRGHDTGDAVLRELAGRLQALTPAPGQVCRLGGDEFVVVLPAYDAQAAQAASEQMRAALMRPCLVDGVEAVVGASVGIALAPAHGQTRNDLLRRADIALYAAKAERGSVRVFTPDMDQAASERAQLLAELRLALKRGELLLHYQPRVRASDGRLTSVEALVRWQHPRRQLLMPGRFIELAEGAGLLKVLGTQVLEMACRQMAEWRREGVEVERVSVNVSMQQFGSGDLPQLVGELLARHGLPPAVLELEITESLLAEDAASAIAQLHTLREMGVTIALDDFGTGYSAMSRLRDLPVQVMKIDRSFVADLQVDEGALAIAKAIVALADALKLRVVAEGVETAEQAIRLRQLGCDELQGYHFARPMPAAALPPWQRMQLQHRPEHHDAGLGALPA